jgi:hypothetical protein
VSAQARHADERAQAQQRHADNFAQVLRAHAADVIAKLAVELAAQA